MKLTWLGHASFLLEQDGYYREGYVNLDEVEQIIVRNSNSKIFDEYAKQDVYDPSMSFSYSSFTVEKGFDDPKEMEEIAKAIYPDSFTSYWLPDQKVDNDYYVTVIYKSGMGREESYSSSFYMLADEIPDFVKERTVSGVSSTSSSKSGLIKTLTPLIFVTSTIYTPPFYLFYHITGERGTQKFLFLSELFSGNYRFRFTSSSNKVSEVVIIRLFAWNPRCVVIISVNSWERSTLLISRTPLVIYPLFFVMSSPIPSNSPEFAVAEYKLSPCLERPEAFAKFATAICPNSLEQLLS